MPVKIACPKCQQRYQLPESALGKAIKCKSCGVTFRTKAPGKSSAQQRSKPAKAAASVGSKARKKQPSRDELAEFGINGPISTQPADVFGGSAVDPRSIPRIGNFAAEDPGFSDSAPSKRRESQRNRSADESNADDPLAAVLTNPHTKKSDGSNGRGGGSTGKSKRGRKSVSHPEVQDSLNNAAMTMFLIGVGAMLLFGFMFYKADAEVTAMVETIDFEQVSMTTEKFTSLIRSRLRWVFGSGIALGAVLIGLGFGVRVYPITCSIAALVLYLCLEAFYGFINPAALSRPRHYSRIVFVCIALGKAIFDAVNARSNE